MAVNAPDERPRPDPPLSLSEKLRFMRIAERETTKAGRRMVSAWASPDDLRTAHLDETFKLMWRESTDQPNKAGN